MNWQNITVSADNTYFLYEGKPLYDRKFWEVLKFHAPGLAPVKDETGSYHISVAGNELYSERFSRTFGYYCNRAAVVRENHWFHLTEKGERAYLQSFSWVGNFQENLCTVRDQNNNYFHIDCSGKRISNTDFIYCGDYKDGIACVKTDDGYYRHINTKGGFLNEAKFYDLGVFHKNFATAKDITGWFHIDKLGVGIYSERYLAIEPYYNGFSLVTRFDHSKCIIDEKGRPIMEI